MLARPGSLLQGGRRRGTPGELIRPWRLLAPMSLTRAQAANARSTSLQADGSWAEYLANTPRFYGTGGGLLVEGTRTDSLRNPRAEGAAAGVAPTHWIAPVSASGITVSIVGAVAELGMTGVELEFSGTAAGAVSFTLEFEAATQIVAASGQVWSATVFQRLSSGVAPTGANDLIVWERDAGGSILNTYTATVAAPTASYVRHRNSPAALGASAARINSGMRVAFANGEAANCRIRYCWPQLEQGGFPSTPILPAVGNLAASVRSADLPNCTVAALGGAAGGVLTVVLEAVVLWSGNPGVAVPWQVDDGTASNRFRPAIQSGSTNVLLQRVLGGAGANSAALGAHTVGVLFKLAVSGDGAGRMAGSLNAAAIQAVTGGPTAGLANLRCNGDSAGGGAFFGEIRRLQYWPVTTADGALPALSA